MHCATEIQRIVKAMRPLPNVAQRILALVQDSEYEIDDLIALVRTDPSLVARVLRLCNSARSGLSQEIEAIGDAVAYVGTRNLVQLTLASCAKTLFDGAVGNDYVAPDALWRHSLTTALLCQELAQRTEVPPTTAFTAGILHDVGRIALGRLSTAARCGPPPAADAAPSPHELVERAVFGIDHAAVAGQVGDHWQLPAHLVAALRDHHDDAALLQGDELPALLHVADQLALTHAGALPFGRATAPLGKVAVARLGVDDELLARAAARATEQMQRTVDLLNLDVRAGR